MDQQFRMRVEEQGPLMVLHLEGALAQLGVYQFKAALEKKINDGMRYAIVNLNKLGFIDSAGIGSLTQIRVQLQKAAGALALAEPRGEYVRSALHMSQLARVIPCFETQAEARQFLAEKYGITGGEPARNDPAPAASPENGAQSALNAISERLERMENRLTAMESSLTSLSRKFDADGSAGNCSPSPLPR